MLLTKVGHCRNIQIAQDFKLRCALEPALLSSSVQEKVQKPKEVQQHCTVPQLHMGRLPDCPAGNLRILMVSLSQGLDELHSTVFPSVSFCISYCIALVCSPMHLDGQFVPGVRRTALYFLVFLTQCILRSVCSKL